MVPAISGALGACMLRSRLLPLITMLVLASVPPIDLLLKERKEAFQLRKVNFCVNNDQENVPEALQEDVRKGAWLLRNLRGRCRAKTLRLRHLIR